jgi:hypothetical protein
MIASQKIGKSFMGALAYNIKKLDHPDASKRAELLDTNFTAITVDRIRREVDLIRQFRPNLNRYVYHTSLNFSNEEIKPLDNDMLLAIAKDYLDANGFTNNQYLIFRHYDAEHPHLHLLVNRISFDGKVVSDSNNYKRSEEIVRQLEMKYGLLKVQPSKQANRKAPKKNEIEMAFRTGKPSYKMALQETMIGIIDNSGSIHDVIRQGEQQGIYFLFNQASTGRVSGITYFTGGFKIKGQALGNQFKWNELAKKIKYEQTKDSAAIGFANSRTKAIYGIVSTESEQSTGTNQHRNGKRNHELYTGGPGKPEFNSQQSAVIASAGEEKRTDGTNTFAAEQDAENNHHHSGDNNYSNIDHVSGIQISDDIDDEAIHGRNRHRQKQARTNRR